MTLALLPLFVAPGALAAGSEAPPAAPEPLLSELHLPSILDRMDHAASLYREGALKFSCRETIHSDGKILQYEYLYVVAADGMFHDYRTRVGDSRGVEVPPRSIPVKHSLARAYSWVFLFERGFRRHVRYRILGTGEAMGRRTVLVGFEPIPPLINEINDWIGTAWVEPETGRVVRVEAKAANDQQTLQAAEAALESGTARRRFQVRSVSTEFGVEKNGMLLPSQAIVEMEEHLVPGRGGRPSSSRVMSRTVQTYANYRFFGVTAEEKHPRP